MDQISVRSTDKKEKIVVFDTTLRDGEQASGFHMFKEEKYEIAKKLAQMGVDVIEAGFPGSSPGDFESVSYIAENVKGPVICGLARCVPIDIDSAGQALQKAEKKRIHVFIATSQIHMDTKFKKTKEWVIETAVKGIRQAKQYTDDIEFSCEDFSRTDLNYSAEIITEAIIAGATTINFPDTVGYSIPDEMKDRVEHAIKNVKKNLEKKGFKDINKIVFSCHCHNDRGLATANTIAAVQGGCRQVEVTINGIGERAGNAAMEEVVVAINTRPDHFNVYSGIKTEKIYELSQMVAKATNNPPQKNKAIVGENAFKHEAGIHQDGVIKNTGNYESIRAEYVGQKSRLTHGPRSGRNGFKTKAKEFGIELDDEELNIAYDNFMKISDELKSSTTEHIIQAIAGMRDKKFIEEIPKQYKIKTFSYASKGEKVTAEVIIMIDGKEVSTRGIGNGPIDAGADAINKATRMKLDIVDHKSTSVQQGKDAVGKEEMKVKSDGFEVTGIGFNTDVVKAAADAFVDASNNMRFVLDFIGKKR